MPVGIVGAAQQFVSDLDRTVPGVVSVESLATVDLAPLPPYDEYGTVSMYLMLAWCIGGYMVAMFIGLMGRRFATGPGWP
ncbi:hypothetical protein B7R22_00175 [Subtercola boreus]|uniref:Uncharacterized protein n=1 Tax=Subtercola boreus TaxID=120213 RepID=A0A3E0W6D0_9MICO|nr:hypothetical protein [Subtercola boreus]RFA17461.1 hypothetical protein B7R22_00175 [Subtercola boreus]